MVMARCGIGTPKLIHVHRCKEIKERKISYFLGNFSFKCEIPLKKEDEKTEIECMEL